MCDGLKTMNLNVYKEDVTVLENLNEHEEDVTVLDHLSEQEEDVTVLDHPNVGNMKKMAM